MNDYINRQAAIHEIHKQVWLAETAKTFLTEALNELPSADVQPEPRNKNNAEVISILSDIRSRYNCFDPEDEEYYRGLSEAIKALSAEPEIIRCKDCKYAEVADKEDRQDGYTCQFHRGSIWFSGSYCSWAER